VIEAGGLVVGAMSDLTTVGLAAATGDRLDFGEDFSLEQLQRVFGRRVDAVVFGATHREIVAFHRGVLLVNPGSPTLPARPRSGAVGTAALLELERGVALAEIVTFARPR